MYKIVGFLCILISGVIVNSSMALNAHKWLKNDLLSNTYIPGVQKEFIQ